MNIASSGQMIFPQPRFFFSFFFFEPALLDFPLAQHVGQELDTEGWGQLPPFEEEERKLC